MFTPELMKYVSHIKTLFVVFSFYNVEKQNESVVSTVRNNGAFMPWQTSPTQGNGVSSEYSSTQNLFTRSKCLICNVVGHEIKAVVQLRDLLSVRSSSYTQHFEHLWTEQLLYI